MSITELTVIPEDVYSHALGVRIDGPQPVALAEKTLQADGASFQLTLGILGASHVVDVTSGRGDSTFGSLREEISCNAVASGEALGDGVDKKEQWGTTTYHLRVRRVTHEDAAAFAKMAREIVEAAAAEDSAWLLGTFPGQGEHHITALRGHVHRDTAEWATWHFYPDELVVVESSSELRMGTTEGEAA